MTRVFYVKNMSCPNCKRIIIKALMDMSGVKSARGSLPHREIVVEADENEVSDADIIGAMASRLYSAKRKDAED